MAATGACLFAVGYARAVRCSVKSLSSSSSNPCSNNNGKVQNQKPVVGGSRIYAVSTEQKISGARTYPENGRMKVKNEEDGGHINNILEEEEKHSSCNVDDNNIISIENKKKKKKKNAYAMALEGKRGGIEQRKTIKDYLEESKVFISSDAASGGRVVASPPPPWWFSPVDCGPHLDNAPLLLYLPGFSLLSLSLHFFF